MENIMTKEQFLALEVRNISQVYNGKRDCCRCGCGGSYTTTTYSKHADEESNNSLVEKKLKRAKKLVEEGADVDFGRTYIDVETGNDRTLTFYVVI